MLCGVRGAEEAPLAFVFNRDDVTLTFCLHLVSMCWDATLMLLCQIMPGGGCPAAVGVPNTCSFGAAAVLG